MSKHKSVAQFLCYSAGDILGVRIMIQRPQILRNRPKNHQAMHPLTTIVYSIELKSPGNAFPHDICLLNRTVHGFKTLSTRLSTRVE
jgi:hypothetical protein